MNLTPVGQRIGLIALGFACGAVTWMLIGATSAPSTEMLAVQATPDIYYTDCNDSSGVDLLISVCSPSRGPVTNLKRGNVVVEEAISGVLYDNPDSCLIPLARDFTNIGDGFYVVSLEPSYAWWFREYALRIKVTCPLGVGIAVASVNMMIPCSGSWYDYFTKYEAGLVKSSCP